MLSASGVDCITSGDETCSLALASTTVRAWLTLSHRPAGLPESHPLWLWHWLVARLLPHPQVLQPGCPDPNIWWYQVVGYTTQVEGPFGHLRHRRRNDYCIHVPVWNIAATISFDDSIALRTLGKSLHLHRTFCICKGSVSTNARQRTGLLLLLLPLLPSDSEEGHDRDAREC